MQYRNFGKLDWKSSALGFGAMRLPLLDSDTSHINEELAIKMIRYAIDQGVNYVDTSFTYHMGQSEVLVGKALQDGYRQKVKLATKLSVQLFMPPQDINTNVFDRYLESQLTRLKTNNIDFYLLHGLNKQSWALLKERKVFEWAENKMAQGIIGNLGFSFHDDYATFKEIVDYYDQWTFCQVQYNYLDKDQQAGRKGVEYAAGKGLAVIIMEPLRGGQLAKEPPPAVAKVWGDAAKKHSHVEWALKWLWNQPEISIVLSGMSEMEQVVQNIIYAGRSSPNALSNEDLALFTRIDEAYKALAPIPCTGCRYCQPCPNNVNIPKIFEMYNEHIVYENPAIGFLYISPMGGLSEEQRANHCLECGECIKVCPQHIKIPDWLKIAHEALISQGKTMRPPSVPHSFEDN